MNIIESKRTDRQALVAELEKAGVTFKGNTCKCPFHDDNRPSAGVYQDEGGVWRFKCQSCGASGDVWDIIARAEGRDVAEVLKTIRNDSEVKYGKSQKPKMYADIEALKRAVPGEVEAVYEYTDPATGKPDMIVLRSMTPDGKTFRQARPQAGGFVMQAPSKPWPLYNRGRIRQADSIVIVEGEKDVHALHDFSIVATTSPAGAGKAEHADWTPLAGKNVILWPDNDVVGQDHMREVETILRSLEPAPRIARIDPADLDLQAKEDAADYIVQLEVLHSERSQVQALILETLNRAKTKGVASGLGELIELTISGKRQAVKWPWPCLSGLTKALLPGTVTVLCGNAGASKSFALLEAAAYWYELGIKIAVYELEEDRNYHLLRCLAQRSKTADVTDPAWVRDHPEDARTLFEQNKDFLDDFGARVHATPETQPTFEQLAKWTLDRAKADCRIISIDPITAAAHTRRDTWAEDGSFLHNIKRIAVDHSCSILLVTHPTKTVSGPDLAQLAGGAAYSRFAQTILWLENHAEKSNPVTTACGTAEMEYNRTLWILKARNGKGQGVKLAFKFDSECLTLSELGLIRPNQ